LSDEIALTPADPSWPEAYQKARDDILSILPQSPLLIEHIGSTAVPGLDAKPVIDIIVLIADMVEAEVALPGLERLGYELRPGVSNPRRWFLRLQGADGVRTHHLHIHTDADDVRRHVLFRDLLRSDPVLRANYLALKRDLAARHSLDREAYAKGKDDFIDAAVEAAGGPPRAPFWNA